MWQAENPSIMYNKTLSLIVLKFWHPQCIILLYLASSNVN